MSPFSLESDPLVHLSRDPEVAAAAQSARAAVDELLWRRELRGKTSEFAAESALRGAIANAEMEGAGARIEAVRSGAAVDESPVGRVLAGSLRLSAEIPHLVGQIASAPRQALARMHAVTAAGIVPDEQLGRPRQGAEPCDDPLRAGSVPSADDVAQRLESLAELLVHGSSAPAVIQAAIVAGELAAMRPFTWGSGLVARSSVRLVLAARGVDPGMLSIPEGGLMLVGRTAHVAALRGYMSGELAGVNGWLLHVCAGVEAGARAAGELASAL
jgi:hypothetical protein